MTDGGAAVWRTGGQRVAVIAAFLSASLPVRLSALQCPDGSPPPCRTPAARASTSPPPNSVAVLYFDNLSRDTADAYLADGLTEELIVRLGRIERLRIKSRAAVQRYRRPGVDPVAAGRQLGVGHLVTGTVRRAGDRLRVTVELVRLPGGDRLWGERYERSGVDAWAIQEDIARGVGTAVAGRLAPSERARLGRQPTASPDAYDHYLRGNYHLAQRSPSALARAVAEYTAAVRIDARFSGALARIGYAYALFLDWDLDYAGLPPDSLLFRGLDASDRALTQHPSASEAWMARGYLLAFRHPQTFDGATAAFERAITLDSANAEAYHQYGWILAQLARDSAAAATYLRTLAVEPDRAITLRDLAMLRMMQRRFAEARRWLDSAIVVSPGFFVAYADRAKVHLQLGELAQARADAETALRLSPLPSRAWGETAVALVEAREGNSRAALARVEPLARDALERPHASVVGDAYRVAGALATAGDHERALTIVERVRPRGARLWFFLRGPELDPIRAHPRFQRVVEESRPR
ncbi:MAG: tetratricopeptide repeat protein [Gemmatimonadales bacterium]